MSRIKIFLLVRNLMKKPVIAAVLLVSSYCLAGPFGLHKGMTLEELKGQGEFTENKQKNTFSSKSLISGHPDFEIYSVVLTPAQGLCSIRAGSKDIKSSSQGSELEGEYKNLLDALTEKYGLPTEKFDFLKAGSTWTEPQYWMMGLFKKERVLTAYWKSKKNSIQDSIQTILIEAKADSLDKGYVIVSYEFDNFADCIKILNSKRNSTL